MKKIINAPEAYVDEMLKGIYASTNMVKCVADDLHCYCIANKKPGQFLCGFSMETENMIENSKAKLTKKNLDMIAANNVKVDGAGFGVDTNVLTLITSDSCTELPLMSKAQAADALLDEIIKRR